MTKCCPKYILPIEALNRYIQSRIKWDQMYLLLEYLCNEVIISYIVLQVQHKLQVTSQQTALSHQQQTDSTTATAKYDSAAATSTSGAYQTILGITHDNTFSLPAAGTFALPGNRQRLILVCQSEGETTKHFKEHFIFSTCFSWTDYSFLWLDTGIL